MDFHNFYTIYVFKVKESTADIPFIIIIIVVGLKVPTELPCFTDLEIPSQLPVW